jgi:glycosyltransferase involved in cell wall biosynthesis
VAVAERPRSGTATATWYVVKGSNDTYWRVEVPAKAIGAEVCFVPYATGQEQFEQPGIGRDRAFRWYETDEGAAYPDHQGAAVFTRPDQLRAPHALQMKADGARIVAEVDDNYLAPTGQNPQMKAGWKTGRERTAHLRTLACFDALIVTTDTLAGYYRRGLKEIKAKTDIRVCSNHVDADDWPEPQERPQHLRVGWMGSPSHEWDIELMWPALSWSERQRHEIVIVGHDPKWYRHLTYRYVPWVDPLVFDRRKAAWPIDIGLAPLVRNQFNLGKSDVKFLEYTMAGAATVASNIEVYSRAIRHGETGLLAGSWQEMLDCVRTLSKDRKLRDELAANAAQYVREERVIEKHADEWREAITGC